MKSSFPDPAFLPEEVAFSKKKLYGRRRGRPLSERQQGLLDSGFEKYGLSPPSDEKKRIKPSDYFEGAYASYALEIGFGYGEHLCYHAQQHPQCGLIGCEPFQNAVAHTLVDLQEKGIENVRVYPDNAWDVLETLEDKSLEAIYLYFPDPWPKKRHFKRRFFSLQAIPHLHQKLKQNGVLQIATDHDSYFEWMLEVVQAQTHFSWENEQEPLKPHPTWTETRYQRKANREGRPSRYIRLGAK